MKNFWKAAGLTFAAMLWLSACEREMLEPEPAEAAQAQALPQGAAYTWRLDLPALHSQAAQLDEAQWVDWSQVESLQEFPVVRVRRSEMLKPGTPAYTTDGKTLTPSGTVQAVVVDGETRSGGRARFVIDRRNLAGWYEEAGERMFFESTEFGSQTSEPVRTVVAYTEAEGLKGAQPGQCDSKDAVQASEPMEDLPPHPDANCWKTELIMHGDWPYYVFDAGQNINNANFGMLAFAVVSDPAYAAINMDLVVSSIVITTTPTNFTTNTRGLLDVVVGFWGQFFTKRDAVLYVSGANLTSTIAGTGALGEADGLGRVCTNVARSVAVCEWQRNTVNGLGSSTRNGRVGAHELGHLLNATHTCGLMTGLNLFSSVAPNCASSSFSTTSRNHMNNHIWFNHGCLHQATCN